MKIPESQLSLAVGIALVLAVGYNFYHLVNLTTKLNSSYSDLASSTAALQTSQQELATLQNNNTELSSALKAEKDRNDAITNQIDEISDTVGVLEKIKNTDPELLKKYSKVAFLNENYAPSKLSNIAKKFLYDLKRPQLFHAKVIDHLEAMLQAAADDEIDLRVTSAFRSFGEQAALKTNYLVTYGSGVNQFSADQGYSEHQLGTTVDLILPTLTSLTIDFEKTEAYKWLTANAYKYGFVLSYPKGNAYYQFEPWHWRFVGVRLAKYLHVEDKYFYDLDQRKIDEYRAKFFD